MVSPNTDELVSMAQGAKARECCNFLKEIVIPKMRERRLRDLINCPPEENQLILRQQKLAVLDELLRELEFMAIGGEEIEDKIKKG